jgi:hypothetical protein
VSFDDVWAVLDKEEGHPGGGYLRRRILPESVVDLHLALDGSARVPALMLVTTRKVAESGPPLPACAGLESARMTFPEDAPDTLTIVLKPVSSSYRDVFRIVVDDIVTHVARASKAAAAIQALVARLVHWQQFLRAFRPDGLSEEARRGLFGELHLLARTLIPLRGAMSAVTAWVGPSGAAQDFQFSALAIEVKATIAKQHHKFWVASERQLEEPAGGQLYVFHVSLDVRPGSGDTLPDMIEVARNAAGTDAAALALLNERLIQAGYIDAQRRLYASHGYTVRRETRLHVREGFPRVLERDLVGGVGDVTYSVALSACGPFAVSREELASRVSGVPDE